MTQETTQERNYTLGDLLLHISLTLSIFSFSLVCLLNDKVKQQDEMITKLTNLNGKTVNTIANIVELLKSKQ